MEDDFIPDSQQQATAVEDDFIPDAEAKPKKKYLPPQNPYAPTGVPDLSEMAKPLVTLPRWESTNHPTLAATYNVAKSFPEFLTSPVGIVSAPIAGGALGSLGQRLLTGGFAGDIALSIPEQLKQREQVQKLGTPQQKTEADLGLAASALLAPVLAYGALKPRVNAYPLLSEEPKTFLEKQRLEKILNEKPKQVAQAKDPKDLKEPEKMPKSPQEIADFIPDAPEKISQEPKPLRSAEEIVMREPRDRIVEELEKRAEQDVTFIKDQDKFEKLKKEGKKVTSIENELEKIKDKGNDFKNYPEASIIGLKQLREQELRIKQAEAQARADAIQKIIDAEVRPELETGGKLPTSVKPEVDPRMEFERREELNKGGKLVDTEKLAQQRQEELNAPKLQRVVEPEMEINPSRMGTSYAEEIAQQRKQELNKGGKLEASVDLSSKALPTAEQKISQRIPETPRLNVPPEAVESKPLKTIYEIAADKLQRKETGEVVSSLGEKKAQASPRKIDENLRVGEKVPLKAGESTLFNEIWDKEVERFQKEGPRKAEKPNELAGFDDLNKSYKELKSQREFLEKSNPSDEKLQTLREQESKALNAQLDFLQRVVERRKNKSKGMNIKLGDNKEGGFINLQLIKDLKDRILKGGGIPGIASDVMRLRAGSPTEKIFGDVYHNLLVKVSENVGKYPNRIMEQLHANDSWNPAKNRIDDTAIRKYAWEVQHGRAPTVKLTPEQKAKYDIGQKFLVDVRSDQNNFPVPILIGGYRKGNFKPGYFPDKWDAKKRDILFNKPNSIEGNVIKNKLAQHLVDESAFAGTPMSMADALQLIRDYVSASAEQRSSPKFKALREAEGYGLPYELVEKSFNKTLEDYANNVATDFAWHEVVESDPLARGILDIADQKGSKDFNAKTLPGGGTIDPLPSNIKRRFTNTVGKNFSKSNEYLESANGLVKALMMQTKTGMLDATSSFFAPLRYMKVSQMPKLVSTVANPKKLFSGYKAAMRQGVLRNSTSDYEASIIGQRRLSQWMRDLSEWLNVIDLRRGGDVFGKSHLMIIGRMLAEDNFLRAGKDKQALAMLEDFAATRNIQDWRKYIGKPLGSVPEAVLDKFGAAMVDKGQGVYDPRRAPSWSYDPENPISPFFRLMRWTLDHTNVITDDVIRPALQGDFRPFFKYAFAGMLTAEAMRQFLELMNRSGLRFPSIPEAAIAGMDRIKTEGGKVLPEVMYQMAGSFIETMNLASVGGLITYLISAGFEASQGKLPMGVSFPIVNFVENISSDFVKAVDAIKNNGEPVWDVMQAFARRTLVNNVQVGRMINQWLMSPDEVKNKAAFRDVNVWKQLYGEEVENFYSGSNPFLNASRKQWMKETDTEKIFNMMPEMIEKQVQKSEKPEDLKKNLGQLRSSTEMPFVPPSDPEGFERYMRFLEKTRGKEYADKAFDDWIESTVAKRIKQKIAP